MTLPQRQTGLEELRYWFYPFFLLLVAASLLTGLFGGGLMPYAIFSQTRGLPSLHSPQMCLPLKSLHRVRPSDRVYPPPQMTPTLLTRALQQVSSGWSRCLLPAEPPRRHRAHSAVSELEVVRRFCAHPVNETISCSGLVGDNGFPRHRNVERSNGSSNGACPRLYTAVASAKRTGKRGRHVVCTTPVLR